MDGTRGALGGARRSEVVYDRPSMRTLICLVASSWLFALAACDGSTPPGADADHHCTGVIYDHCITEHDCMNMQCMPFQAFMACTQQCTVGDDTTCPLQGTTAVTCGANAFCAPAAPNDCTL